MFDVVPARQYAGAEAYRKEAEALAEVIGLPWRSADSGNNAAFDEGNENYSTLRNSVIEQPQIPF